MHTQVHRRLVPWSAFSLVVALLVAAAVPLAAPVPLARAATTSTFSSSSPITIPEKGVASPYPSEIDVNGMPGLIRKVTVTVKGLTHTYPDDIGIVLTSPTGTTVRLMSDVGRDTDISGLDLTFDDDATQSLPDSTVLSSGTYRPTDGISTGDDSDQSPTPFPGGPPAPYNPTLSSFNLAPPNGKWTLYVYDDHMPDGGSIDGWSLTILSGGPTATNDTPTVGRDTPTIIPVLANDTTSDDPLDPTSVTVLTGAAHGSTAVNPATGTITYVPHAGYTGPDSFTYTVSDSDGLAAVPATVNLTVTNQVDLGITKTKGPGTVTVGSQIAYTLVVSNAGPSTAFGATIVDAVPPELTGVSWTCTPAGGASCALPSGTGSIGITINLPPGGTATFAVTGTVAATGSNSLANTASVGVPPGLVDTNPANNSAQVTDVIPATNTPTPTSTATATPTPLGILGPQTTATPGPVRVSVQRAGTDRLLVTIAAVGAINQVTWPSVANISVETSAGVPITGGVLVPPPGSTTAVFYVRKTGGSSATLPLTVTGAFPTWQTFVGGGPNAW